MLSADPVRYYLSRNKKVIEASLRVNTIVRGSLKKFLDLKNFIEINPVIISPISDPLNHPVKDPVIDYYGNPYRLTKSMIFHKQLAMIYFERIYSFSPNIRIEPLERRVTGRHLAEFTQLDLEVRNARREDVMDLAEDMINKVVEDVGEHVEPEFLNPKLAKFKKPFRKIKFLDAKEEYGDDFESALSNEAKEPFWIIDIPLDSREFYDKETAAGSGILRDMDLVYPYGYGEAVSGGEREYEYERICERIRKKGQNESEFSILLEASKIGLKPSAGFGIGIERLVRFIRGLSDITDTTLFPKTIGDLVL
ncbi:MAG: asparagine synthetase A [Candidatus Thermoplasmatota archaeon]|jgi:asparaginyl-tRNA synthetase|nr:asparagine synthetase A [Candidatus Thermoplasmatota archaeon]MCL5680753.1 asparagine synthetase A [Candidatus Thermoplasmatota archaeon]